MPCNCSGIRMRRCNCTLLECPLRKNLTHNVVMVPQNDFIFGSSDKGEQLNFFLRFLNRLYDKCAAYNLRYCSLRGVGRDKHATNALKELVIIICFLVANFVVFLNIATRMFIHVYLVFTEAVDWLKKFVLKSACDYTFRFEPQDLE